MQDIQNIKNEALAQIMDAGDLSEVENIRVGYLGRNGKLTLSIKGIKDLPKEERKQAGLTINEAKKIIEKSLAAKKNSLKDSVRQWFDATIPGELPREGHLHLVTQAIEEISNVFKEIGFVRVRYPEVEWDWFAFGSLNFGKDHPARDDWETFFVDAKSHNKMGPMILTPHTSSGQVREMKRAKNPPIRMINIAKCYRRQSDISHLAMFHQFEGLVIDTEINITNLKGTLDHFAKQFFGPERKTRIRQYTFPFTEPSFEVDINCGICKGTNKREDGSICKVCKEGWLEIGGAGMVHPTVLENGGIDPKKYTGFAFGWGVERVAMMKAGIEIPDIRLLYSSDLRFLKQF